MKSALISFFVRFCAHLCPPHKLSSEFSAKYLPGPHSLSQIEESIQGGMGTEHQFYGQVVTKVVILIKPQIPLAIIKAKTILNRMIKGKLLVILFQNNYINEI